MSVDIKYLYHSGFIVETKNYFIVFDYYKGYDKLVEDIKNTNKKVLIFSSHSHYDHFNAEILNYTKVNKNIYYIFSDDINIDKKYKTENVFFVQSGDNLNIEDIMINVFGSTDIGVSFLVEVDEKNIFHAGDLNFWHWPDDTKEEKLAAQKPFEAEINKIEKYKVDIAFFPVDPRLEHNYHLGGSYFIEKVNPREFIPMHFQGNYYCLKTFKTRIKSSNTNIRLISFEGQKFIIN